LNNRAKEKIKLNRERNEFEIKCGQNGESSSVSKLKTLAIDVFLPEFFQLHAKIWRTLKNNHTTRAERIEFSIVHGTLLSFSEFYVFGRRKAAET
jgi:hypothetical protein